MTTRSNTLTTPATKGQIIAAHTISIAKLMRAAAAASAAASQHVRKGDTNVAISYLLEIEEPLRTVATLTDAVLAIHGNRTEP
jgi:hypothetical protein